LRNRDLYLVEDAIDALEERFDELTIASCDLSAKEICPLDERKMKNKLNNVLRKQRKQKKGRSHKGRERALNEKRQRLEEQLQKPVRRCSQAEKRKCRENRKDAQVLRIEINRLKNARRELINQLRIEEEYLAKKQVLDALAYLRDDTLLDRGKIALDIHVQELFVTELIANGFFHDASIEEICGAVVGIDFDRRRGDGRNLKHNFFNLDPLIRLAERLATIELNYLGYYTVHFDPYLSGQAYLWAKGADFQEILRFSQVSEGDLVAAFRRSIDILRQVRNAVKEDVALADKITEAIKLIDRDVVSVNI
ncbi:MAG TPA: hypothetical protein GX522_00585, partial [Firmicutes bacterium]|nr:hypothetical protein [Bacillota bacterium]